MILRIFIFFCLGFTGLAAQWSPVPAADFSRIKFSQFADHEIEVPYFLRHFAQVANSVVETGEHRGFLDLKVNREPVDNQPYNARIMEMQMALAYFYASDRPWNPYRGSVAVRVRLEAMLARWVGIQAPQGHAYDGLFAEYSATNWSLAPSSFGARAAAETLDLIVDSGLAFDTHIFESARLSLRRVLMAVLTRSDMRKAAREYSNQFSGVYQAALIYLENWPDSALESAFVTAIRDSGAQDQSPTGFWYEQGGPDFGYSSVHETTMRMSLPRFRMRADLMPLIVEDDVEWNEWLAANYVPQPGLASRTFLANAGINTRTSHALQTPRSRPWSEFVEGSRIFALSREEFDLGLAARRAQLASQFGNWGGLAVPSGYSYIPAFVHDARGPLDSWHPTVEQRDAADARLACLSPVDLNLQFHDPRPTTYTMVKRSSYYAALSTGTIRISRQVYGLGLLWNPVFGIGLQSQAATLSGNQWVYGTRREGMLSTYETAHLPATFAVAAVAISTSSGARSLPKGELVCSYALASAGTNYGSKTMTFGPDDVQVSIVHLGDFSELLPLAYASDAVHSIGPANQLLIQRANGSSLLLEVTSPGASISVGASSGFTDGILRRPVRLFGTGRLDYRLAFREAPPATVAPSLLVRDMDVDQPNVGNATMTFPFTLSRPSEELVRVAYRTESGSALAGAHFMAVSGTLDFLPGPTESQVEVLIPAGSLELGAELNFKLILESESGCLIDKRFALGTIRGLAAPPPPPAGSVNIEFVQGNSWSGAYQGTFRLSNLTGANITAWELDFDFGGDSISFFNGTLSSSGSRYTFKPLAWQSVVGPGAIFENLGFQASPNQSSGIPTNLVLRIVSATGVLPLTIASSEGIEVGSGEGFSKFLQVFGGIGPYRWELVPFVSQPSGIRLEESGLLVGSVSVVGEFQIPLRVVDARGVSLDHSLSLKVSEPDAYRVWASGIAWSERDSSANEDPDSDGLVNLMEYALGGDPLRFESTIRSVSWVEDGMLTLQFSRIADPALVYEVQAASTLSGDSTLWETIWTSVGLGHAGGLVNVRVGISGPAPSRRFLRLRVSRIGDF
jgi:hypothetical protein